MGFLPPGVFDQCRPRSFLDERSMENPSTPPRSPTFDLPGHHTMYQAVQGLFIAEASQYLPAPHSDVAPSRLPDNQPAAYLNELERARIHYLGLVFNARRYMSSNDVSAVVQGLEAFVGIIREHHADAMSQAAPSMSTQPSNQGINSVFTNMTLSPQTDITNTNARGGPIPVGPGYNDLAHVYDPPLWPTNDGGIDDEFGDLFDYDYMQGVYGGGMPGL
jgi:hypothetical protein